MVAMNGKYDSRLRTRALANGVVGSFGEGGDEKPSGVGPPRRGKGSRKSFQPSGSEKQQLRPPAK